jgi:serine/threonine-protein kinase
MALTPGARLGPYEIAALIGEGGMGEVYRAVDTTLGRAVAIKILPEAFAADTKRLARFEREARTLAALNHPNIAHIYAVDRSQTTPSIVMEFVDGPTLADRVAWGPIPVDEALPIARQIAEALEAAHEQGIVHRDLKPANVKVRDDGTVKVLDFGLAKAVEPGGATDATSPSPTITSPVMLTGVGTLLGTAGYMSPEQAQGRGADKRSDVWTFGAVLYEMLSGRRAFKGDDVHDTLAAILGAEPAWSELPVHTPPAIHRLLRRCLHKDPKRRYQHIGDVRLDLTEIDHAPLDSRSAISVPAGGQRRVALALASASALILLGVMIGGWLLATAASPVVRPIFFAIGPPTGHRFVPNVSVAISTDGSRIVFPVIRQPGRQQLFLRSLDSAEAVALAGTEAPMGQQMQPFFSPDGTSIAFFADGRLKRVPVSGGTATTICAAPAHRGGAWSPDDRIVFAPDAQTGLFSVPASGGEPEPLTTLDASKGETSHRSPIVLPDGNGLLFTVTRRSGRMDVQIDGLSLRTRARSTVLRNAMWTQYVGTGHLVYVDRTGETFAGRFDPSRLSVIGTPVPLPERPGNLVPGSAFALSVTGTAVTAPFEGTRESLLVVRRDGTIRTLAVPPRSYRQLEVSPDGRRLATTIEDGVANFDIWTLNLASDGPLTPVTTNRMSISPLWSADSKTLTFAAWDDGERSWKMLAQNIESNETPRVLFSKNPTEPKLLNWLSDGSLLFTDNLPEQPARTVKPGEEPRLVTHADNRRHLFGVSPDERWLAYMSDRSGRDEVWVMSFPDGAFNTLVSRDGGTQPIWAKSDTILFYRRHQPGGGMQILEVPFGPDGPSAGRLVHTDNDASPLGLFPSPLGLFPTYDVLPDGSFIVARREEDPGDAHHLEVVVNWPALRGLTTQR